jgi:hypothetical protein
VSLFDEGIHNELAKETEERRAVEAQLSTRSPRWMKDALRRSRKAARRSEDVQGFIEDITRRSAARGQIVPLAVA